MSALGRTRPFAQHISVLKCKSHGLSQESWLSSDPDLSLAIMLSSRQMTKYLSASGHRSNIVSYVPTPQIGRFPLLIVNNAPKKVTDLPRLERGGLGHANL